MLIVSADTVVGDGEYVALEKIAHPIPSDPNAARFQKNTLVIRNNEAILDKVPVCIRDGKEDQKISKSCEPYFERQFPCIIP